MFRGLSRDFEGDFVYVVFSSIKNDRTKKHINKILPPTHSRDNPANLFMFMCFSFPEEQPELLEMLQGGNAQKSKHVIAKRRSKEIQNSKGWRVRNRRDVGVPSYSRLLPF